ncbi:MAG: alpha/beta fold hydrolase [Candidatus Lambdaproteobacteria bacterium]|nr:alpha/beta fold hydrolase [Candidatus Lambdaproteobacteria bacterium]
MATPFRIETPEAVLHDLRERLRRTRWPGQVQGIGWAQGSPLEAVQAMAAYWLEGYDWRAHEAQLNALPHFRAEVDGQVLHFIHLRSTHAQARPLLLQHGWPGSFYEFVKLLPLLTQPEAHGGTPADAFHVVVPSLPGYTFSPPPAAPGMGTRRIGGLLHRLMQQELGYARYGLQGGDWGAVVTSWMAQEQPQRVLGLHLNMQGVRAKTGGGAPPLDEAEQAYLAGARAKFQEDMAYYAIQGTRPQTLGYGLTDSPAGLLGWLLEKFRAWTDCGGELENALTRDEFLTNLTLYWVTGCIASSTRLYYEHVHSRDDQLPPGARVETPTGFANFPGEIFTPPRRWVERAYNVVRWTDMPRGGHFAAFEQPALLAGDLRAFFAGLPA